jgi:nucleoside-diphosphate-sugar epimerase
VLELLNKSQLRIQNFSIDGNNVVRDFVHISHLLNFLALCSYNSKCGIYNFSNGLPVAVKDMLELRSGLKIDSFEAADKIDPLLTSSGEPGQMTE